MKFSHPDLLYALFLLIIPIIVHLFRLRKFRKEDFTNVKFLKRISIQTRKSSELKKWLILITRMLILASIIIAFAGPYFPKNSSEEINSHPIIYLDNSYSMEARGKQGALLERSIQNLISSLTEGEQISLFTNNNVYENLTKSDLQEIQYSPEQLDFKSVLLKAEQLQNSSTSNKLLLISDFQKGLDYNFTSFKPEKMKIYFLPLSPESINNQSIDTAFLASATSGKNLLKINLSQSGNSGQNSVSVYNRKNLLGRTGISYSSKNSQQIEFPLDLDSLWQGKIEIEDNGLQFDNSLYFSINKMQPVKVVSINKENDDFLKRIFISPEFNYQAMKVNSIDFSSLSYAQVIILNELDDFPSSLRTLLKEKIDQNSVFIIIPPSRSPGATYENFLKENGFPDFTNLQNQEKLITGISFNHPLYNGVFEEKTTNFDYPKVQSYYRVHTTLGILTYEDHSPFLLKMANTYIFTSPLNTANSNFAQSPLIVPTFFNMGLSAAQPPAVFYTINSASSFDVPVKVAEDEVLHLTSDKINIIPEQQRFSEKVRISTENLELPAGNYEITYREKPVMAISFNVERRESKMNYAIPANKNLHRINKIQEFIDSSYFQKEEPSVWKWFVIFALFFLIIETLLLKYIK